MGLRGLRFTLWAVVVAALLAFAWFNLIGLPAFLKTRLVATLRERDLQLEFTRMRLRFIHGLVAENVRLGLRTAVTDRAGQPALTAAEVQLHLNFAALLHARFQLDGIVLRDGKLTLPLSPTNALTLRNLETDLRFQVQDTWSLDNFHADFAGVRISLAGEIVHAPEMRDWKIFTSGQTNVPANGGRGAAQPLLRQISDTLERVHFGRTPMLSLTVNGDARKIHSFIVRLTATAPAVRTPWFSANNVQLGANLTAPADAPTNAAPAAAWWTNLQPFRLAWNARADGVHTKSVNADAVEITGVWHAPELAVSKFSARLGGGSLHLGATLDVGTGLLNFTNDADFDLHAIAALFPESARPRLAGISWAQPPMVRLSGSVKLPAWTNRAPDWSQVLTTTANVRGELALTNTVALGVTMEGLRTHFTFANQVLNLTDFSLAQGRTRLELDGEHSFVSKIFAAHVCGRLAPESVTPWLLNDAARRGFGLLSFSEPLALDLAGGGNLTNFNRLNIAGHLALTNFAVRSQTIDSVATEVTYTNLTVNFSLPHILRAGGKQMMTADNVVLDLAGEHLCVTNGFSTVEPLVVGQAIGPKTALGMSPYQFLSPPAARVNGCIPLHNNAHDDLVLDDADLRVDIVGDVPFRWRKFETPRIAGTVHWLANYLIVTNAITEAYGGPTHGWGSFNLTTPGPGTDFQYYVSGTNVDFHRMAKALWAPTNNLEGALSGWMEVTHANSDDWRTWNGFGAAHLHDGLLWDIPTFSLLSPVLNTFLPGLGNSRATEATAQATLTNGIIFSDSLEIRSLTMRLQYIGTVDLQENVNAKVTAQLLRNTWGVGPLMSAVLWPVSKIFECQVTGTLGEPKAKPVLLLPRILMVPLHPIRSMEEMFAAPATNNPVAKPASP